MSAAAELVATWLEYAPEDEEYMKSLPRKNLNDMMTPRIAMGTAGLRAEMGPGFARMNMVTVQMAAIVLGMD